MTWGYHTILDLKACQPERIRSALVITNYVKDLIELINMKAFGECEVVYFGDAEEVARFTMVQKIETSLISGHFVDNDNAAYIDIFSCKPFDGAKAANFTQSYFGAESINRRTIKRG